MADRHRQTISSAGSARRRCCALALVGLLALACGRSESILEIGEPDFAGGGVRVVIHLGDGIDPAELAVWVDGRRLRTGLAVVPGGVEAELDLGPGRHRMAARARAGEGPGAVWDARGFRVPPPLPALLSSDPAPGAGAVVRSAWLRLSFSSEPRLAALAGLGLACDGESLPFAADRLGDAEIAVNPAPELPAGAACALAWRGPDGIESLAFATEAAGPRVEVVHDRTRDDVLVPFPDDFFLVGDASTLTGRRVAVPVPARGGLVPALFDALTEGANRLDGWSPLAPVVVETTAPLDPDSLPLTPEASLDPLASIQWLDLAPGADAARVPFRAEVRSDATDFGASHTLLLFPARPLDPRGRYALVVTRRAFADPGSPLEASGFLTEALAEPSFGEPPEVAATRALLEPVVALLEGAASPRIPREDLALLLPISVRSNDTLPDDLLAMREQIAAAPRPALLGFVAEPDPRPASPVAAIVRGTWDAPDWRPTDPGLPDLLRGNVVRDADGVPVRQATRPMEFVLALPAEAAAGPVPLVIHQHGNPGDQGEVLSSARSFLAEAGFAAMGFTDVLNREVAPALGDDGTPRSSEERIELQVINIFVSLFVNRALPDHWLETTAEQLAFLRFVESLADLDVLPLGAPDGLPDLDLSLPLVYHGISEGANHGQALVAYAPELRAAALVAGGARLAETLIHQQAETFLTQVPAFVPGLVPSEIWVGVSLFQALYDRQDRHNHLTFAGPEPLEVGGTTRKASLLLVEGLDDTLVPNGATESAAWALGLPQILPLRAVPFLETIEAPVAGNLGSGRSGALMQYAPTGLPDVPATPGCDALSPDSGAEGHYCAQSADESRRQRVEFFRSALGDGPPEIVDPFAGE